MKKKWYYKPGLSWERRKKFLLVFLLNVFLFFWGTSPDTPGHSECERNLFGTGD